MNKDAHLHTRCASEQLARWKLGAHLAGKSLSDFVAAVLDREAEQLINDPEINPNQEQPK